MLNKYDKSRHDIMKHLSKTGCIHQQKTGVGQCGKKLETSYYCEDHNSFTFKHKLSKFDLRNKIIKNTKDYEWIKNIPFDSKSLTVFNAYEARKAAISNLKNVYIISSSTP